VLTRPARRPVSRAWAAVIFMVPLLFGWSRDKAFVSLDEDAIRSDGYASQVAFIRALIEGGGNLLDVDPLYWIHGVRTLLALGFEAVHGSGGPLLTAAVMLACVWPLLALFDGAPRRALSLLLPLTAVALSYRAVLVQVAIGYLLLYILRRCSPVYLLLAFLFANLSSGAVLSAVLIALLLAVGYRRMTPSMVIFVAGLVLSLGVSVADKYAGFMAREAGYDATVEGATGIVALLSRSTIFVSVMEGDYLRALTYTGMFAGALYALLYAAKRRRYAGYAAIFVCTIPAFLLEGLGVISLVVPVLMFLAGVPLPRTPYEEASRRPALPRARPDPTGGAA
jgi:hypothetical protein